MNDELSINMSVVEHEARVTVNVRREGDDLSESEKLDSVSIGGEHLDIDADELRDAFRRAVVEKADYIQDDD